jgi:adaptin ear-binding coat-associated protein 1/2
MEKEEEIEYPLFSNSNGMVFKIPPMSTTHGHRAEDWRGKCCWQGLITITENRGKSKVSMINPDKTVWGSGYVGQDYLEHIERCFDSSRFFAVKIVNENGQAAVLGIGFPDRNISFDFINAFKQFQEETISLKNPRKAKELEHDFSLKEGEKITVTFGGGDPAPSSGFKKTGGKLQPPPQSKKFNLAKPPSASTSSSATKPAPIIGTMESWPAPDEWLKADSSKGSETTQEEIEDEKKKQEDLQNNLKNLIDLE